MAQLLKPTGILVCLEFPLYKDLDAQGPPWGLKGVYWDLLAQDGDGILQEAGRTGKAEQARENDQWTRVLYYKPDRTYDVGNAKDTDMISVWKLV